VIRELRHADRANRLANRFSLRQQNIDLTQLRDDLFGLMLLLGHSNVLSNGSIAYFREDHFSGGRPTVPPDQTPRLTIDKTGVLQDQDGDGLVDAGEQIV